MTVERLQRGVSIGLVAFALAMLAYPAVRLFWDFEIDYNEGWNAVHQARAIAGQPLYGSASPLFFNNYPPLSFYLIGGLGSFLGDSVRAGRLVSLFSLFVLGACCYGVLRASGARRAHALVALATCLGLFAVRAPDYVAMNDPQLLAHAFLCVGLLVYVHHRHSPRVVASVPLWFALGLLTKHNVLLVPLLVSAHVLLSASPRVRLWYSCSAVGLVFAVVITLYCVHGSAFFHALAAPRVYDLRRAFQLTVDFLVSVWLPMGPVLLGLIAAHTLSLARWVSAYLALSLLLGAALSGGAGVDVNVFFDAFIAMALGAGLIAQWLSTPERAPRLALAFALVANAGLLAATPSQLARLTPSGLAALDQTERRFQADVAYLQTIDGPAICESTLLCLRAGKQVFYDPFNVLQATATGRLPADAATRLLDQNALAVVQLSSQAPTGPTAPYFENFSRDFFAALDRHYMVARRGAAGRFYTSAQHHISQR